MDKNFKLKLLDLYDKLIGAAKRVPDGELRKMIGFGARADWGEHYFLFIYRDFYRDPSYYGAVIFFNKPDKFENPVTIIGLELNGKEQVRNHYVIAALFFLKNQFQDTMTLSGNATVVFNMAKDKINAFIEEVPVQTRGDELKHFDFDIAHQEIQAQEIKPKKTDKKFNSRFLADNLLKLQKKENSEDQISASRIKAKLGLRQICLFPRLVDEKFNRVPSAKFDHFKELLEDILAEDHKVLVFSQFVQVLKMLRGHCDEEKFIYSYIDGSVDVNTREKMVKSFQEDEGNRVFLLSLKAGGVALNLTAADYVIIFDPWWNPAVEAQAIDRSHRIGQTKKVMVYRMVVKDSIEEKMLVLQEKKKALVENLIASDAKAFKNLEKEDILDIFNY